jgi:hypothetical protein
MGNSTKDSGTRRLEREMELEFNSGLMDQSMRDFGRKTKQMGEEE